MRKTRVEPAWLSLPDAAVYLGITERTLRDKIKSGELPAYRMSAKAGSHFRIKRSDLDALLEAHPVRPQ